MDPKETFRMVVRSALDLSIDPGNGDCRADFLMYLNDMTSWVKVGGFMFTHVDLMDILAEES